MGITFTDASFLQTTKGKVLTGLVIVFVLLALGAYIFINATSKKVATAVNDATAVELRWWSFFDTMAYSEIISAFKLLPGNANVNITIEKQTFDEKYYPKFIQAKADGFDPDLITMRNDDLPTFQTYLTPIETFDAKKLDTYKKSFVPLVIKETVSKDKVYAVSTYTDNLQLYSNKNMLQQQGILVPASTWDEIKLQSKSIRQRDNRPEAADNYKFLRSGIGLGTGMIDETYQKTSVDNFQDILATIIFQYGGELYDYKSGTNTFTSSGQPADSNQTLVDTVTDAFGNNGVSTNPISSAVEFYTDFANERSQNYSWNLNQPNNLEFFAQGKLAYIIGYSTLKDDLQKLNPNLVYDVSDLPQINENQKKNYGSYSITGLNKRVKVEADANLKDPVKTKKYQKAQEFLAYLTQKTSQQSFITATGLPPNRYDLIQDQLQAPGAAQYFARGSIYVDNYYKPNVFKVQKMWNDMFWKIDLVKRPWQEALTQAQQDYSLTFNAPRTLVLK